jgi:hypothetical protein
MDDLPDVSAGRPALSVETIAPGRTMDDPPDLLPFRRDDAPGPLARGDRSRPPSPDDGPVLSFGMATLRARLDAELAGLARLGDRAAVAVAAVDATRAEMARAPRGARGPLAERLAAEMEAMWAVGRRVLDAEAAIRATRLEIKRAGRRK